ncbi:tyrosine-type recombinase/integrase, partial [Williamsia serinedens]
MTALYATQPTPELPSDAEFELLLDAFLSRYRKNTRDCYERDIRMFCGWLTEMGLHPFAIRRRTVEAYVRHMIDDRGNLARSVNRRLIALRMFYEFAIDDDYILKNPCRNVRLAKPKLDLTKKLSLTREEFQRFMRAAYDSNATEYAMCTLMGYLGMRVTEVCELTVPDVLHYSKGHRVVQFVGKGGDAFVLPQPPVVMRSLDALIDELGRDYKGPLFLRRDGSQMTRRSADRVVKRLAKKAAIADMIVSPHTLRHSAIVNAISAGIPLRDVQIMARHRDISTTIRVYDRGRFDLDTHATHGLAAYLGAV